MEFLAAYSSGESDEEHSAETFCHVGCQSPSTSTDTPSTSWSLLPSSTSPMPSTSLFPLLPTSTRAPSTSWSPLPSSTSIFPPPPSPLVPPQASPLFPPRPFPLSLSPASPLFSHEPSPLVPQAPSPLFPQALSPLVPQVPSPLSLQAPSPLFPPLSSIIPCTSPAATQGHRKTECASKPLNTSPAMGYISRRKRRAQDPPEMVLQDGSLSPSANVLFPYLPFDATHSSPGKQARHTASVPRCTKRVLTAHSKPVLSMEWHPQNSHLLLSASLDGGVRLWDVAKERQCVATYNFHSAAVRYVDWTTDTTALSAGYDHAAVYMDIGYAREIVRLKHSAYVSVVKSHPLDRNLVLTGDFDGKLQMWDLRVSKCTKLYKGACGKILDAAFLPKCDAFVASADIVRKNAFSQAMNVWDLDSGVTLTHQLYFEPFTCPCLKVHGRMEEFLAQSNGNYIVLFSATKPFKLNKRKRFQGHFVSGFDVGFDLNPDGSVLCSASSEGKVHFYDYVTTKLIRTLSLDESATLAVTWNRNFPFLVAVSDWKGRIHILQ